MKKNFFSFLICAGLLFSCKQGSDKTSTSDDSGTATMSSDETSKTGKFTVDGKEYTGKVEVQKFGAAGKENFSVLCQWDGPGSTFALLQITFVTEVEAKTTGTIAVNDGAMLAMTDPQPGVAAVTLSGTGEKFGDKEYHGTDKTGSSIMVKGNSLSLKDAKLFTREGTSVTVSADFEY